MIAPDDGIGGEIPDKGGLAQTGQDGRGLRQDGCQVRLVSGQEGDSPHLRIEPVRSKSLNEVHKHIAEVKP
jgi:hypothetical protein